MIDDEDLRRVFEVLDAMSLEPTRGKTLLQVATLASEALRSVERERDRLDEKLDAYVERDADCWNALEGYHAFATTLAWRYPDGEAMPLWLDLEQTTRDAFVAFAKAVVKG